MSQKIILTSKYNMSMGYIPLAVTTILCTLSLQEDLPIYIGVAISIIYSCVTFFLFRHQITNFILYIITGILVLFAIPPMFMETRWANHFLPFFLEICTLIPLLLIYMKRKSFIEYYKKKTEEDRRFVPFLQGSESTIVSIRVLFIFAMLHFAAITLSILITRSLSTGIMWVLFQIVPSLVFIFSIILNQIGISFFNKEMSNTQFIPVVNEEGGVVGKVIKSDATEFRNTLTNPIIRIATISHNMLFLCQRSEDRILDKEKMDIPMETYLLYRESIEEGVKRLMEETFPGIDGLNPTFCIKYQFKNEITSRQVYLFILDLDTEDEILCDYKFISGKLWTSGQIEQNLDKAYFGDAFENEYDLLKTVIETREKYRVS